MFDLDFTNVSLFHSSDFYIVPIVLCCLLFFFLRVRHSEKDRNVRKILLFSLLMKVVFSFLFAVIYEFYYHKVGDNYTYYKSTLNLLDFLHGNNHVSFYDVYFNPGLVEQLTNYQFARFGESSTYNMFTLTLPLLYITGGSYLGCSLLLSYFAFYGSFKLFQVLASSFPAYRIQAAVAALLLPSVSFWSSSMMKDTYAYGALCLTIYCFYRIVFARKFGFRHLLGIGVFSVLIYATKPYILILWPCLSLFLTIKLLRKIAQPALRKFAFLLLVCAYAGGLYALSQNMINAQYGELKRFSVDEFVKSVETFNRLYTSDKSESSFTDVIIEDFTFWGIMKGIPNGILVVFFRPFFWEVRNALMVFSSLESTTILVLTVLSFARRKEKAFYAGFFRKDILSGLLVFSVALALITAFTTPNFGTLSRYKIPCMPIVFFTLLAFSKKRPLAWPQRQRALKAYPGLT